MEIKNKEELLLKLRMNVIELSNEYPTFEKQVVKKIHSTIIKMIERGERYESIKTLINYMIAGGRYVSFDFQNETKEYCFSKYEEHRNYDTILKDWKEDKFFLKYDNYEIENASLMEYLIFETQGNEFYRKCKEKIQNFLIKDDPTFHLYISVIKVKGLYCKLKEAMLKLNYSINDKINSFDDFQKILTELEVYFRTEL